MIENGIKAKDCKPNVTYSGGVVVGYFHKNTDGQWFFKHNETAEEMKVYPHESHLFYPLKCGVSFADLELRVLALELEHLCD